MYTTNIFFTSFIIIVLKICLIRPEKALPSYYPRCYRDDPNLNECLLKATEQVRPYLQKGVPELNVPPISPFTIPEVTLQQGTEVINYKASLKNLVLTGLDTYEFTKFEFDVKKLKFEGSVNIGQLYIKGDYFITGKILAVPIEGKGVVTANVTNSNGTLNEQAKLVTRKGKTYLEPDKTVIKINVGEAKSHLDGLFDGNEELARATNNVIRDNMRELVEEVKPAVEEVITRIIEDIIFKSVAKVPYDKLFPVHK